MYMIYEYEYFLPSKMSYSHQFNVKAQNQEDMELMSYTLSYVNKLQFQGR